MRVGLTIASLCIAWLPLHSEEQRGLVRFGGRPVPGATITATKGDLRHVTLSGPNGMYSLPDLSDGVWTIQVDMQCFSPLKREIAVSTSAPLAEWELHLQPRAEVAVERAAASHDLTQQAQASKPTERMAKLRPAGANTQSAFQTANPKPQPVSAPTTSGSESQPQEMQESARDGFLINGSVNNGANTPFAQSPAFGNFRQAGRSLFSGMLSLSADTSAVDARPFSLTGQDTPEAPHHYFTGGASIGGPVPLLRRWRGANHAPYVFLSYQGSRNSTGSIANGLMPTVAQRGGDFSQSSMPVIDPGNGSIFPGNLIPQSRISPQAESLLSLYPQAGFLTAAGYNYQVPLLSASHGDTFQTTVSKSIGQAESFNVRFAIGSTRSDTPTMFGFLDTRRTSTTDTNAGWNHRIATRWNSRFTVGLKRQSMRTVPYFANRENVSGAAGVVGNNQDPINWGPPSLGFNRGISALSDASSSLERDQNTSLSHAVTGTHGSHNLGFGAGYVRQQINLLSQQNARGAFGFNGAATGVDFADFLLGIPDTSSIAFGNADKYFRSNLWNAYFNDDWHLATGFTLTAGFRWEYGSPITERYGRLVNLDVAPGFGAVAPVVGSQPLGLLTGLRYPSSLLRPDKRLPEPRLGFAWRPAGASSLVIRVGYGLYSDTSVYRSIATSMAQQSPLSKSLNVQNSAAHPFTLADGFNASPDVTSDGFAVDPGFRIGYAQNWQLSIQHDLPGGMVATATYFGVKGTHAQQAIYPNTYPSGAADRCPTCPVGFEYLTSGGNSTFQSAQFKVRRRLHKGFSSSAQYTFGKAIDDASLGGGNAGGLVAQDWRDFHAERGLSNFDQRHKIDLQFQYSSGMFHSGGLLLDGWGGALLRNWTLSSELTAGSGLPETPIYPGTVNGTGFSGSLRPDYTGASLYSSPSGLRLNPSAYTVPMPGRWGNAGRNTITGPSQFSMNASVLRPIRLSERFNLELRMDATNVLNHVVYSAWGATIGSAQFGLPVSANPMRTLRASVTVRF